MRKEDFTSSSAGRLVATEKGQWAFAPFDLPPKLDMADPKYFIAHDIRNIITEGIS